MSLEPAKSKRRSDDKSHGCEGLDQVKKGGPCGGEEARGDGVQKEEKQTDCGPVPPVRLLRV